MMSAPALAQTTAERHAMGQLADGTAIEGVTLSNDRGVRATIITYGATLQAFEANDRDGNFADITLGFDTAAEYEAFPNYFGVTVGRYANRIAGARFALDGEEYTLTANDDPNSLHGGTTGFDKRVWEIVSVSDGPVASVTMALRSPDGDQGYPGNLDVRVTYTLDHGGDLGIVFEATSDAPTIVNMTNHALFNLAGAGSERDAMGHHLMIPASSYTPVDQFLIPTGELRPVAGTHFDFTDWRLIEAGLRDGRDEQLVLGRGYDHNFALDKGVTATPELAARLVDTESGRMLEVLSTEPGLQFYTGNFLDGTVRGRDGQIYRMGDGIALEPQKYPDAPNQPAFISARIEAGETYRHEMIYRVSIVPGAGE
nr:aldose epimerase family protein [Erythrobacter sp. EC-HK427]